MSKRKFLYNPFRDSVYGPGELLAGYDPADPASYQRTFDFRVFRQFVVDGRAEPKEYFAAMMESLHDNSITAALRDFLVGRPKIVGIMGSHAMKRGSEPYRRIAEMACRLTKEGFLVATGGGPGAMEAAHLGAFVAGARDLALDQAIKTLSGQPDLPEKSGTIVSDSGQVNEDLVRKVHAWYRPAFELLQATASTTQSLGVPTWLYGHEPPAVFASHVAKYFQNSLREDGLLAIAKYGVIYAEGRAGTLQEIFQDATQNYYKTLGWFSPMVLFGKQHWTETYPAAAVLKCLFGDADFQEYVLVTDSTQEAVEFIKAFQPPTA